MWDDVAHMQALEREVAHLQTLLAPHDTGHIRTAISVLENRIHEIGNTLGLRSPGFMSRYGWVDVDYRDRMSGGSV
jgi:hypothetical protein